MGDLLNIDATLILDSLGDGVYVTDLERKIIYWNRAAERITGWVGADIVGRHCFDDILCHVDKDDDTALPLEPGDRLLFFSDGAIEIHNAENTILGVHGLISILKRLGYPDSGIQGTVLEEELLKYSNSIRLEDDLSLIEIRFGG